MKKIFLIIFIVVLVGCSEEMDYLNVDDETLKELIIDNYEKQFEDEFTAEQFNCYIAEEKGYGNIKFCSYVLVSEKFPDYPFSGTKSSTNLDVSNLEIREYEQTLNTIKMNDIFKNKIEKVLGTDIMLFVDQKGVIDNGNSCDNFWNINCNIFTFYIAIQVNNYEETEMYMDQLIELNELVKYRSEYELNNDLCIYFLNDFSQIEYIKNLASGTGVNRPLVYYGHVDFSNNGFDAIREVKSVDLVR